MAVPYFDPEDEDAYAAQGQPGEVMPPPPPMAPPEPTVMSPVGPVPVSQMPAAPPPPGVDLSGPPVAPPPLPVPPPGLAPGAPAPPPPVPVAAGVPGAPAAPVGAPGTLPPALPDPGPRPVRPPLTGDHGKDIDNSLAYERQLGDWHDAKLAQATQGQSDVLKKQANDELAAQQAEQKQRDAMRVKQQQERDAAHRNTIAQEVNARAAQNDLETGKWRGDQSAGHKIASWIEMFVGGIGAGLSAAGGHPTGNLAAQAIDDKMSLEYDIAKQKVSNQNEALLQARYGEKDLEGNQRAALNDLDADFAAKHKMIAAETEAALRNRGVSPEQIQANELVVKNLQDAAKYEDNIHTREIEAGRKNELADSTIALNKQKGDAQEALADFRHRRNLKAAGAGGAGGGLSKAATKAQEHEIKDIEAAGRDEGKVLLGSAKSQGAKVAYESAQAVSNELRHAAASGDPDAMKIAVMHAQEQSTRFLTGAAPTQQTFEIQHGLAGTAEQLESKIGGIMGQPTEAKSYVLRMASNIDAISRQRAEVLHAEGGSLKTRLESIIKSDEGKRRAQGILDQFLGKGAVKLGGADVVGEPGGGPPKPSKPPLNAGGGAFYDWNDKKGKYVLRKNDVGNIKL